MSSTLEHLERSEQFNASFNGSYLEADLVNRQQSFSGHRHHSRHDPHSLQRIARIQDESWGIQVQKKRWEESNSGFLYNIKQEQENVLNYFLDLAEQVSLDTILEQFDALFIQYNPDQLEPDLQQSICCVVNCPDHFISLLTDCCYILINTCFTRKKPNYLFQLFNLLQFELETSTDNVLLLRRFSHALTCFKGSEQFKLLQLFFTHQPSPDLHWSDRYATLKLLAIAHDQEASDYQREASEKMHQALKNRYKFQLVMHLTKREKKQSANPSLIHPTTLQILHKLITQQQRNYNQRATQLLAEAHQLDFEAFKEELSAYLFLSINGDRRLQWLSEKIDQHLFNLYPTKNTIKVNSHLITQTVNALIGYLINPKNLEDPSHPFTLLMIQQDCISLCILLLKLILISPQSHTKLVLSLNSLLAAYTDQSEDQAPWLISFLETMQVIFALAIQEPSSRLSV
jgi:hypothetical protein